MSAKNNSEESENYLYLKETAKEYAENHSKRLKKFLEEFEAEKTDYIEKEVEYFESTLYDIEHSESSHDGYATTGFDNFSCAYELVMNIGYDKFMYSTKAKLKFLANQNITDTPIQNQQSYIIENHIQLFNRYKDSCNSESIEYLKTEGKHQFKDFADARNNELNNYHNLFEQKDNLTSYNKIYETLFRQVVLLFDYSHDYSINNSSNENGQYLDRFNLTLIKIKKLLEDISHQSFVIEHFILEDKNSLAIIYQKYCLRVFNSFTDILKTFEIEIQNSPLNELFETTKQELINSIDIERIKLTKETYTNNKKSITKPQKSLTDFIFNISNKEVFINELKETFPTEIGKSIKAIIDILTKENILIFGTKEFKKLLEVLKEDFGRYIGTYNGIQNNKVVDKETTDTIYKKLNPLIIKHKKN